MAALPSQCSGLRCASLSFPFLSKRRSSPSVWRTAALSPANVGEIVCAARIGRPVAITHEQKERQALKKIFEEAAERIRTSPMEGVSFTLEDFKAALKKLNFNIKIGSKVKGTVCMTDSNGAFVDVKTKSEAFLPLYEACLYRINHVSEAGIHPGFTEEFVVVGEKAADNTLILSLRSIQYNLAWERCKQLQAEDAVVKGKVVEGNKGGVVVSVEGIRGFVPFSLISTKLTAEELLDKELPLKIVELDENQSKLILSNRKAVPVSQAQLETGSVVLGTVQSLKPYGAFIDVGGINGLLHISQISHDRITDISTILHLGDTIKVMILSYDRDKGRLSLSTKKLEPTPGDMIHNPKLVFEKADDMAWAFRQRIAQAEALARADMLRFQPESESSFSSSSIFESIFRPLSPDPSPQCLHSNDEPSADGASVSKDNGE